MGCGPGEETGFPGQGGGSGGEDSGDAGGDDTGDEPVSCGLATFTSTDGTARDLTDALSTGEAVTLTEDGTLEVCTGTWFALVVVEAVVTVRGLGDGPEETVLSGGESNTVLAVDGGVLTVEKLTLDRGAARGEGNQQAGGGARCTGGGELVLREVIVSSSTAYDGGGVYGGDGCSVTIEDAVFTDNTATDDGGALRFDDSTVWMSGVQVSGSLAKDGGALIAQDSALALADVHFADNRSTDSQGGAILHYWGTLEISDSTFSANSSLMVGGALALFGQTLLEGVVFGANESERGGAIQHYPEHGSLQCVGCSFEDNAPDDVALEGGDAYTFGSEASFSCDSGGCVED